MTAMRVMTLQTKRARRPGGVLPPVELTTNRLLFRPLAMVDRSQVLAAVRCSREALIGRIPLNRAGETDEAMFVRWVETAAQTDNNRSAWRRAAFLENGSFVGLFNLIRIEFGLEWSCEATCWVDRRFSGRGYATEGVDGLIQYATHDMPVGLGMSRVRAMIQPTNPASLCIVEKLGLRPTGAVELLPVGECHRPHAVYEHTVGISV
jgi:[ribosomal protein S5]-alanine N-acetyltransferase